MIELTYDGEPSECRKTASDLVQLASSLHTAQTTQHQDAALSESDFSGDTADQFRSSAGDAETTIGTLHSQAVGMAGALRQLSWDMDHVDDLYRKARNIARPHDLLNHDETAMFTPGALPDGADDDAKQKHHAKMKAYTHAATVAANAANFYFQAEQHYLTTLHDVGLISDSDYSLIRAWMVPNNPGVPPYHPASPAHGHPGHHHHGTDHHPTHPSGDGGPANSGDGGSAGGGAQAPAAHTGHPGQPGPGGTHEHLKHDHAAAQFVDLGDQQHQHHQQPITPQKHEQLEHRLATLHQQSASLQHRIEVMQQAIAADPDNVDNPLLQQEIGYLGHQLDQHQAQIHDVTQQLNAPVAPPDTSAHTGHGGHGGHGGHAHGTFAEYIEPDHPAQVLVDQAVWEDKPDVLALDPTRINGGRPVVPDAPAGA